MQTHTPTATPSVSRAAKIYWALCAIIGAALTVTVNYAHGVGMIPAPHTIPSGLVAVIPPLMVIALFEGYFLVKRVVPQKVLRVVLGSVIVLGGAAFSISYTSIAMFVNRQPGSLPTWTGWVMPALLDVFVVVSAYVLYVISRHGETAVDVPKTKPQSRLRRLADAATARMEASLEVPAKPQVTPSVEGFVEAHGAPTIPSVDAASALREGSVEPLVERDVEEDHPSVEPLVERDVEEDHPSVEPSVKAPVEPRKPSTKHPSKPSVEPALVPYMDAAEVMVADGVVARKSAVEIARIIAAVVSGQSDNAIKNAGLASASSASKVRAAWAALSAQESQETAEDSRVLAIA